MNLEAARKYCSFRSPCSRPIRLSKGIGQLAVRSHDAEDSGRSSVNHMLPSAVLQQAMHLPVYSALNVLSMAENESCIVPRSNFYFFEMEATITAATC